MLTAVWANGARSNLRTNQQGRQGYHKRRAVSINACTLIAVARKLIAESAEARKHLSCDYYEFTGHTLPFIYMYICTIYIVYVYIYFVKPRNVSPISVLFCARPLLKKRRKSHSAQIQIVSKRIAPGWRCAASVYDMHVQNAFATQLNAAYGSPAHVASIFKPPSHPAR